MKKVLIIAYKHTNITSITEAIKIYRIKHKDLLFTLLSDSFSYKEYCKNIDGLTVQFIENINSIEIRDIMREFDFAIDLCNEFQNQKPTFFFYCKKKDELSFLVPFNNNAYENAFDVINFLDTRLLTSLEIDYIETKRYLNDVFIKRLELNPNFRGVIDPFNFFKLNQGIHLVEESKLDFLKSFYNALNDKQKEASQKKTIGGYFSKIVFSFQKDETYDRAAYNLFSYPISLIENTIVSTVSEHFNSSEFILLFMLFSKINNSN